MYRLLFVPSVIQEIFSDVGYFPKYPKYRNFVRYPRARHRELLQTNLLVRLTPAQLRLWLCCVHPWVLVPKSNGIQSRVVVDTSVLTKYNYPRGAPVQSLRLFLAYMSDDELDLSLIHI